jgi:tetratricopeptide (TPR) repeat protein
VWARAEAARLGEARLAAVECHLQARLDCGQASELVAELEVLTGEHPLRERLWALRMLALYRSGRQAEALETYQQLRASLVQELGIEPGADLRQLHQQILAQDPGLAVASPDLGAPVLAARRSVVPRELPADVAAFTGRAVELAELDFLLPSAPETGAAPGPVVISAVAGTAGVGKTTLAVRWAHRVAEQFPDGQLYVNLRGYDPGQPLAAGEALAGFLRALGIADADVPLEEAERAARYRSVAAGKRLLVVLDNAATEDQVRPLLPGTGTAMVVVTSRDSLAGLVAVDGARRLDLDLLPQGEAVALLRTLIGERAAADLTAVEALAGQCARLPLALRVAAELAVSRPEAPLAELVAELAGERNRLELLDAGGDPHAAVTGVFSWSYRHLPADAARMFRLLGLHPAQHWDLYAAAALTGTVNLTQARRILARLARAHLIQQASAGHYGMHDLLRAYAAGLATSHHDDRARQAALTGLFDYYLAGCAAAMDCLIPAHRRHRPDPPPVSTPVPEFGDLAAATVWLDAELTTLTAVAAHTARRGWPGHTTRLAATLYRYLSVGHRIEGLTICSYALLAARNSGDRTAQASTLTSLGVFHLYQGNFQQAADHQQQALALARDIGDRLQQTRALGNLALVRERQGRYQQAADHHQQALALFRQLDDQAGESVALGNLGEVYVRQGRYRQAADLLRRAIDVAREIDDVVGEAYALASLGEAYYWQGEYRQAADHLQHARDASRKIGARANEAYALTRLGNVHSHQGDYTQAADCHQQALATYQEIGDHDGEADALNGVGETLLATGRPIQAQACHTTALALTHRTGNRYQQARAHRGLAATCHTVGDLNEAHQHWQHALDIYTDLGVPEADRMRSDPTQEGQVPVR